ncbi:GntT/GntP/DsdX family permease [Horticoccus sp. 23ND18S-11]|uniref:GntT/GntP/DsdX family permease n=1 Tax=Horticoccus sp. 23ND18S-11 TaxID=3391832 RepID=UPI0039C99190
MPSSPLYLLLVALAGIALLVGLVTGRKLNAFLALLIAAVAVGLGAGMAPLAALKAFQDGVGATLGGIAAVIALGAMVGRLLAESGGAQVLAERFSRFFGPSRAVWCVIALALVVGLLTWFTVGLLLLLPVVVSLTRETRRPFLLLALPLVAFLSVMHGLTPPHPGPVVAIDALGANPGLVLVLAFVAGIPAAAIGGPLFARWVVPRLNVPPPAAQAAVTTAAARPGFLGTTMVVGLPVTLMLLATVGELAFTAGHPVRNALAFAGHPVTALAVAVIVALAYFGRVCRFTRPQLLGFTEQSIAGIGMTLLVVGGGGGFARVLREAGAASALGTLAGNLHLPPLIYGWLVAAFIRVATGSATVAITTAAGLLAPVLAAHPEINRELLVIALGFGSLFLSHLNDGGFWIVKDCLGLTVGQTLRTWTIIETIIGVAGLGLTLLLGLFL